jgi:hypothetical protein
MPPGERRVLHRTDGTNPRDAPVCQPQGDLARPVIPGGEPHGRDPAVDGLNAFDQFVEIIDGFHIHKAVQTGDGKVLLGLEDDGPRGGILAGPLFGLGRMRGAHFVD